MLLEEADGAGALRGHLRDRVGHHVGPRHLPVLTGTGTRTFVALERVRTHCDTDTGGCCQYNELPLPDSYGGGTITVRLHGNASPDDRLEQPRRARTRIQRRLEPQRGPDQLASRRNRRRRILHSAGSCMWAGSSPTFSTGPALVAQLDRASAS